MGSCHLWGLLLGLDPCGKKAIQPIPNMDPKNERPQPFPTLKRLFIFELFSVCFLDVQEAPPWNLPYNRLPKIATFASDRFSKPSSLVSMLNLVGAKDLTSGNSLHHPRYTWPLFHLMVGSSIKNGIDARLTLGTWLHGEAHQVASTSSKLCWGIFFPRQKFRGAISASNYMQIYLNCISILLWL